MNIAIVGVGLIGGSMALSLRGFQTHFIGVDANPEHAQQALELGIVHEVMTLEQACKKADLMIIAVPVNVTRQLLPEILNMVGDRTVVTDMGSTKKELCDCVRNHPRRAHYVASHPIAGTENSGPKAAFNSLFNGKVTIICEQELSAPWALQLVEQMYSILNMRIIRMNADEHDVHVAYVSHLSHITSFVLGLTVLDIEKEERHIYDLAGSGFASTVRLAKSSPAMWAPIFEQNADVLSKALSQYIEHLQMFKTMIEQRQADKTYAMMKRANDIRRILDGIPGVKV